MMCLTLRITLYFVISWMTTDTKSWHASPLTSDKLDKDE